MNKLAELAEKMAAKALESPAFRQSWEVHMQAFGPILAPAWPGMSAARVHLTNILNKISRRDVQGARKTMEALEKACGLPGPAEKALWHFLHGLCGEMCGNMDAMCQGYRQCCAWGPDFHLPYMKLARMDYAARDFDSAYSLYMRAAAILERQSAGPQRDQLLCSALTNAASALASDRRFAEALALLERVRAMGPSPAADQVEQTIRRMMAEGDGHDC